MLLSILNLFLVFQLSSPKVVLNAIAGNHINDLYAINPTVATELAKKWVINGIPDENQVKVSYCAYHTIGGLGITPGGSSLSRTYTDLPTHGIFFFVITLTAIDDWEPGQKIYVSVDNQVVLSYEPYLYIATEGKQYCGSDTKETVLYANGAAYHSASSLTFSISSDSNPQAAFSINDLKGIFREKGTYAERGCLVPRYLVTDIPSICPCLTKQYYDPASSSCKSCYPTCSSCFGPSAAECYGCGGSKTFDVTTGECVYCTSNCGTCYGSAANQCALCNTNYLTVAGTCSPTCDSPYVSESIDLYKFCYCPEKSYPDNGQCLPCSSGCLECTSGTACTTCDPSTSLVDGKCQCPTGTFFVEGSGCVGACSLGCNECPSNTVCTACDTGTSLVDGVCQCPSGRYYISGAGCSGVCPLGCTACTSNTVCTECNSGPSLVDGKCQCPSGTFYIEGSGCTGTCSQGCNRCSSGTVCTECYSGPSLVSGQCQCLQGKYYILGSGCTGTCSLGCNVCASDTVCTTCQSSASLVNNLCQCPNGKFFIQGSGCTGTCSQGCNRCTSEAVCTECHSGPSLVSGQCQCPSGTFYVGGSGCTGTCSQGCNRCSSETVCTECYTGPTIVNDQCQCPIETFYILGSGCTGTCSLGCNVCSNETFCTECRSPYSLQVLGSEQICKTPCQDTNQYMKAGAVCVSSCDFPLTATTEGTGETQAKFCTNACDAGPNIALYWDGSCQATCSRYLRIENGEYFCDACAPGLFSYSGRTCLPICPEPYTQRFYGGSQFCDRPCPEGQYFNSDNMECMEGCEYPYQIVADDFCAINLSEDQVATVAALAKGAGVMDFAGTTVGRSVGLVQFTNPIPTFIQLFTDMLSYLRYVNVKYPSNLHYYFSKQASDGMAAIPQMTSEMLSNFPKNTLPKKFEANQELHSSFLVNFWQSFLFLLIIAVSIGALIVLGLLKKKPKLLALVHEKLDQRLRWNFTLALFTSYIPDLVLFSSLEFSTFNSSAVPPVLSFLICIGFNMLIITMFMKLFKVILANWMLKKKKVANDNSEKKAEEEKVDSSLTRYACIFEQCRTDSLLQQAFMFITIGRVYLYSLIIGYLYNFPRVQPILIIVLSVLMLAYVILIRPVDGKLELALMIGQEILMLGVNICVLILSRYDAVDEETNNTRTSIGSVAIVMSMTLSSLGLVYLGISTLLQLKEKYPMIKEKIRAFQQKMSQRKTNKKVFVEIRSPKSSVLLSFSEACTPQQGGDETLKMSGAFDKDSLLNPSFSPRRRRIQEHSRGSGQDVMLAESEEITERRTLTLAESPQRLSRFEREFNFRRRSSRIYPLGKERNEDLLKLNSLAKDNKPDGETLRISNDASLIFKVQSGGGNLDVMQEM